ncbi:MAG TPA: hypothetical protein VKG92_04050 [Flavobacteriales bacterium]|nr:hypothetical protein [Flavobacteriales bacterium]
MQLRVLLLSALILTGVSIKAQAPVLHYFQSEGPFDASAYKHAIEEVVNIDPTALVGHSDDMTVLQVTSTSGLIESAYRTAIGQAGITLRTGSPDLAALGLLPTTDPDTPPVFVVSNDPTADLARYQTAVDQWNLAHPEQPMDRTPLHLTGK